MQGLAQIARQNAASQALYQANQTGENRYVVYDDDSRLAIVAEDPGPGRAVYIARPGVANPAL